MLRLRCSLCELQPGRKSKHRLNISLHSRTTLIHLYILNRIMLMEARQSPFMLPSCLEAYTTPRHENIDRAPFNPPSTRQHPLAPATTPGSPAVTCSEYTHADEAKKKKGKKKNENAKRKQRPAGKVRQVMKGGDFQVEALRGQGCTNRARVRYL